MVWARLEGEERGVDSDWVDDDFLEWVQKECWRGEFPMRGLTEGERLRGEGKPS